MRIVYVVFSVFFGALHAYTYTIYLSVESATILDQRHAQVLTNAVLTYVMGYTVCP